MRRMAILVFAVLLVCTAGCQLKQRRQPGQATDNPMDPFAPYPTGSTSSLPGDPMQDFLSTYDQGKAEGRYIPGSLPKLDFPNDSFDMALSSHFLLLYTDNLSYEFHHESITEMLRIAKEVRIFPLLDVNAKKSSYVERILKDFSHCQVEIRRVNYEFQIDGNEFMIIKR